MKTWSLFHRFEQPGVEHHGIFTHTYTHTKQTSKAWKRNTEPAALQASRTIQVQRHDATLSGLVAELLFQNGGCRCQILARASLETSLEAETSVSNLTQCKLLLVMTKQIRLLEWPSPVINITNLLETNFESVITRRWWKARIFSFIPGLKVKSPLSKYQHSSCFGLLHDSAFADWKSVYN